MEVIRFQRMCRLCADEIDSQTNDNGFDCKNSVNLKKTIKHLYGVEVCNVFMLKHSNRSYNFILYIYDICIFVCVPPAMTSFSNKCYIPDSTNIFLCVFTFKFLPHLMQIRADDGISTMICGDCLDKVVHFQSYYKKVQMAQIQFAKYHQMVLNGYTSAESSDLTSTSTTESRLEYSCTVIEKQTVSSQYRLEHPSMSNAEKTHVQPIDNAGDSSTVISIGQPAAATKSPPRPIKRARQNSVNFGTMTITTIPVATSMRMKAKKRTTIDLTNDDSGKLLVFDKNCTRYLFALN